MNAQKLHFKASGKLMLFGEYVVMRGVPALAFPIKLGQQMTVQPAANFRWCSFEADVLWFELDFNSELEILQTNNNAVACQLMSILKDILNEKPDLFLEPLLFEVRSNFNRNWGFGSSATLISLLAQWSGMNAFVLNERHFGGSGYDIACATASSPVLYFRDSRQIQTIHLPNAITEKLLFVYYGKKQISKNEVVKFGSIDVNKDQIAALTELLHAATTARSIESFEDIIEEHEIQISKILNRPTLKSLEFDDYPYSIKSLGAWGGDFFMATCRNIDEARMYFIEREKEVAFTWPMLVEF